MRTQLRDTQSKSIRTEEKTILEQDKVKILDSDPMAKFVSSTNYLDYKETSKLQYKSAGYDFNMTLSEKEWSDMINYMNIMMAVGGAMSSAKVKKTLLAYLVQYFPRFKDMTKQQVTSLWLSL